MNPITDQDEINYLNANASSKSMAAAQPISDPDEINYLENQNNNNPVNQRIQLSNFGTDLLGDYTKSLDRLSKNVIAGLLESRRNVVNSVHKVANMINPSIGSYVPTESTNENYAKELGLPDNETLSDKVVRGLAQYAPAMAIPEAEGASLIGNVASNAARQGAFGATQNPDNPLEGGAYGALAGAGGTLLGEGINRLRPSVLFRGNLSPEDLKANQEAAGDTTTGLGRVLESPSLSSIQETWLPNMIGTGADSTMQQTANHIIQKGNDLLDNIKGDLPDTNFGVQLQNALKKASQNARNEKNQNYQKVNDLADKENITVGRTNLQNTAQNALDDINQSQELKSEVPGDLVSSLKRYTASPSSNAELEAYVPSAITTGNSLKLSNIFKGKLGDKANDYYQNGQMYEYGIMKNLQNALKQDIQESIDNGSPEFKEAYQTAEQKYKENFAPFEDPNIVKFTRQGGDPDLLLSNFIKGGQNDRGVLITKLQSALGPESKNLPLYAYLSRSAEDGNVNPVTLSSLYEKLGENQKNALIPDQNIRNQLENYTNLVSMNRRALDLMFRPKTGFENISPIIKDVILKGAQLIGGGYASGGLGAASPIIAGMTGGRYLNKLLTSPDVRNNLINKMLQNKRIPFSPVMGAGNALINKKFGSNNNDNS